MTGAIWSGDAPLLVVAQKLVTSIDSFPLMAVPLKRDTRSWSRSHLVLEYKKPGGRCN